MPLSPKHPQPHRPVCHYTPAAHWMNDPNGLFFHQGLYHLFYQYHPDSAVWGPMHWGHATSADLVHWQEQPVALAPDEHGMIFSGSAVVDVDNTSGLAGPGQVAIVALFTYRDKVAEERGDAVYESQGLAWSLDHGMTWRKHPGPVLPNPGFKDFRDPKVFWHVPSRRWLMALACGDRVALYASTNLHQWQALSSFTAEGGAGEGVWECPDLFELPLQGVEPGRRRWVLLVSTTAGGPAGGSATRYFVGDFDGQRFVAEHEDVRWLDAGPDHYAGVTWNNTPGRCLFVGWMSNWLYALKTPTSPWRGAMTLPRELALREVCGQARLCAPVAREVEACFEPVAEAGAGQAETLSPWLAASATCCRLHLTAAADEDWSLYLADAHGSTWRLDHDAATGHLRADRRRSGHVDFDERFAAVHALRRSGQAERTEVDIYLDACSVEVLVDAGLDGLTQLVFPQGPWVSIQASGQIQLRLDRFTA